MHITREEAVKMWDEVTNGVDLVTGRSLQQFAEKAIELHKMKEAHAQELDSN